MLFLTLVYFLKKKLAKVIGDNLDWIAQMIGPGYPKGWDVSDPEQYNV